MPVEMSANKFIYTFLKLITKKIIKNNILRNCIASDCIGVSSSYIPFKEGHARFTTVLVNICFVSAKIIKISPNLTVNLKDLITLLFAWRF